MGQRLRSEEATRLLRVVLVNQAARLVTAATHGQILVSDRILAAVESLIHAEAIGQLD